MVYAKVWNRLLVLCLLIIAGAPFKAPVSAQTWYNTYGFRRAITIPHTNIPNTDQVNFPVLLSGTYSYLATTANGGNVTNSNGYDIIFTSDATGATPLPFEAESYNATTGAIVYWVQVPLLSHTTDTVIYMFYGNSSVTTDQSNKTGVWDTNYAGVWHLANGTTLSASDSTANNNNGTITGATATTGEIDGGASFNGNYQNVDAGNSSSLQIVGTSLTLEAWLNTSESNPSQYERILVKEVPGNASPYMAYGIIRMAGANTLDFGISSGSVSGGVVTSSSLTLGAWTHVVGTYDGSNLRVYLNGVLSNTASQTGNILSTNQDVVFGEDTADTAESYNGMLDEVRISNSVRSADWVASEYANQSNPSSFYTIGNADSGGGTSAPVIASLSPSGGPTGIPVSISGGNFGATQGGNNVTFGGIVASPISWSPSSIVVTVPTSAMTGPVVVTASGVASNSATYTLTSGPGLYGVSPSSGPAGTVVMISGENFGPTQGNSTVSFSNTAAVVVNWSDNNIVAVVPNVSVSGAFTVSVGGQVSNSLPFSISQLPSGWSQTDVGTVSIAGNAAEGNNVFTLQASGTGVNGTADGLHFVYQSLSGDGSIVARVVSLQNGYYPQAGVMIRETLDPGAAGASTFVNSYSANTLDFGYRTSSGASWTTSTTNGFPGLPYWIELVRSGSTFTSYISPDGLNWTQLGSSQTITMGQNAYIGLTAATLSNNTSSLTTAIFDNVSITSAAAPGPVITALSSTTGTIGSQVAISGSGFGNSWGLVMLHGSPVTINSWTSTNIVVTIPSGATSGPMSVSVAPEMIDSNYMNFSVTSQPLPTEWLDQDVGYTGVIGSSTFTNGAFTVNGAGFGMSVGADQNHFAYQTLSGDGSIVARIVSVQGNGVQAGVMIRETLAPNSVGVDAFYNHNNSMNFNYRTSEGGNWDSQGNISIPGLPYWVKLVRAGDTFTAYTSTDGLYWTQLESSEALTMAQNVYIGLEVSSGSNTALASATFDNVSINSTATVAPVITGLSATTGPIGSQIVITGYGFGASIGTSVVLLNDAPVTVNSWSDTSVVVTVPSGASSGFMVVAVGPTMNASNGVVFTVTSQALPSSWLDADIGAVNIAGSATYASGIFTVQSSGSGIGGTSDAMHFVYQPLSGDGSITARLTGRQGGYFPQAGVMIRETLDPASTNGYMFYNNYMEFSYRTTTGASTGSNGNSAISGLPYWVRVVRTGNSFSAYYSPDGQNWTQRDSTQTISMAQNVYIGLGVSNTSNASLTTATFDNVSIAVGTTPFVTETLPVLGGIGASVTITGANFGATEGTSSVTFNGVTATSITSWSDTQIVATVPAGATTGIVNVVVNSIQGISNANFSVITPVITSVSPPSAPIGGQITINGTGFGAYNGNGQVEFNGATVNSVYPWTDTSVTVAVPSGVTSGNITLVEDGVSSNSIAFNIIEGLSVTTLTPTSGQVGATVSIAGTGFGNTQSDSAVTFDGIAATVVSWSDTSIMATVPTGASTGPVTVAVAGITANGPGFQVTSSIQVTDSLGHQSTYASVIAGGKWYVASAQGSGCSTCTLRGNISYQFDVNGNVVSSVDSRGYSTSYAFDSSNDVAAISQPSVSGGAPTTYYTYNSLGEVLTATDALGNVTTNTYDGNGNLTSVTTPAPSGNTPASVTRFAYNSLGELTQITDPLQHATTIAYNSVGLISSITDAQDNVTSYGYDSRGNRTSVTNAAGQTTFAYDSGNRLTTITYPDSSTTTFGYDYRGRRTSVIDQNGKTTSYAYDDADRLISVTDAASNVTQYGYDTESNLTSITDANSHTTSFTYDALGRVTQTTFPSNLYETYGYDANNNITSKTDRKGQTIQYVYDALNRLTEKDYPDSTKVEYTYDLVGKIMQASDPTGTYGFSYDNMGRLTGTSTQYSFLTSTFTNSYSYDANSNRTGYTAPDSSTNTYTYDTLNRLTNLSNSWAGSFGFSYDALSRRTQMTRPNGVTTNYTYDDLSHLVSVLHQLSGSTIDGASYTVDSAGNRTAKTDQLANVTTNYGYDSVYQLLSATQGGTTTESYTYDAVGNRLSSLGVSSYTSNSSNEVTADSNSSFTYDYNGNMTSKTDSSGTTNYSWDYENRMTRVTLPGSGSNISFKYDPFGRRIQKISPTSTSIFIYDGDGLNETVNSTGSTVARYTQGQNIDESLAMQRGTTTDYYEQDGIGSVTSLTTTSGSVAQTYTYDSFGNTTNSSGSLTNFFRYTSRESDTETNLYYYRARYYDATSGRFISEDPIRFSLISNPRLRQRADDFYSYVENDPVGRSDPRGLWQMTIGGGDGFGGVITFGHNSGQWNFGFYGGVGEGLFGSFDPTDSGCHPQGFSGGVHAEGDAGEGKYSLGLEGEVGLDGSASGSVTVPIPGGGGGVTIPLPPGQGPSGLPHGTLGGGAGAAIGIGGTSYFGGGSSCGCN